jgi:hypothetical protein
MNDDQLRALIRESVARHLGTSGIAPMPGLPVPASMLPPGRPGTSHSSAEPTGGDVVELAGGITSAPGAVSIASAPGGIGIAAGPGASVTIHISHATFALPTALDGSHDGPCQTEPHAGCTTCGFCQSLGY